VLLFNPDRRPPADDGGAHLERHRQQLQMHRFILDQQTAGRHVALDGRDAFDIEMEMVRFDASIDAELYRWRLHAEVCPEELAHPLHQLGERVRHDDLCQPLADGGNDTAPWRSASFGGRP
jgi:hypothetical protein